MWFGNVNTSIYALKVTLENWEEKINATNLNVYVVLFSGRFGCYMKSRTADSAGWCPYFTKTRGANTKLKGTMMFLNTYFHLKVKYVYQNLMKQLKTNENSANDIQIKIFFTVLSQQTCSCKSILWQFSLTKWITWNTNICFSTLHLYCMSHWTLFKLTNTTIPSATVYRAYHEGTNLTKSITNI